MRPSSIPAGLVGSSATMQSRRRSRSASLAFRVKALELRPPSTDCAGSLEQVLQAGAEHSIVGFDGVLKVADQIHQADLVLPPGPACLGAEAVRDPEIGSAIRRRSPPPSSSDGHRRQDGAFAVVEHPHLRVGMAARIPVSSDAIAVPPSRRGLMSDTTALNGSALADRLLMSAPSLIERPNNWRKRRTNAPAARNQPA